MKLPRRQFLHLAAGAAALPAVSRIAWAQTYPTRPVRMIVPFGPGGPTDAAARLLAQKLSEHFGQQFYVENVPGVSANIGTGQAARAAPDGHTILVTVNNYVINPSLFKTVPYDPYKDFEPVSLAVTFASALTVHPSVPATTVKELVRLGIMGGAALLIAVPCGSMVAKECASRLTALRPNRAICTRDENRRRQQKGSPKGISLRSSRNGGVLRPSAQSFQCWSGSIPPPYISPPAGASNDLPPFSFASSYSYR